MRKDKDLFSELYKNGLRPSGNGNMVMLSGLDAT